MPFSEKATEFFDRMEAATTREELMAIHDDAGAYLASGGAFTAAENAALAGVLAARNVAFRRAESGQPVAPPPAVLDFSQKPPQ